MSDFDFRSGAVAAKESSEKKSPSGSAKTEYFNLKDGESTILRFLTDVDEIITVDQHTFVSTRPAPSGYTGKFPQAMNAICRRDPAFGGTYADCFICDHLAIEEKKFAAKPRAWALAAVREPVYENGSLVGLRDAVRRVPEVIDGRETGREVEEKAVVIVNMAFHNFFSHVFGHANSAANGGTLLNRDYEIRRSGSGLQTSYTITGLDKITMEDGKTYDLRDPDIMARYRPYPDLTQILVDRSSDDYYARFFDTRVPHPQQGAGSSSSTLNGDQGMRFAVTAPTNDMPTVPTSASAEDIMSRVTARNA